MSLLLLSLLLLLLLSLLLMSQFEILSFVTIWVFEFSHNLSLSVVTIWVFDFCHNLRFVKIWVFIFLFYHNKNFGFCQNLYFLVLSQIDCPSSVTILRLDFVSVVIKFLANYIFFLDATALSCNAKLSNWLAGLLTLFRQPVADRRLKREIRWKTVDSRYWTVDSRQ